MMVLVKAGQGDYLHQMKFIYTAHRAPQGGVGEISELLINKFVKLFNNSLKCMDPFYKF